MIKITAKILLVEDDMRIRHYIRTILSTAEYTVLEAENASGAVSLAASHNPDIILLDLGLPDEDGLEVIRKIREWSQTPIIVVSARSYEHDKVEALDIGANDYVTKPFGTEELLARIRAALRYRSQEKQKTNAIYSYKDLIIDSENRLVTLSGKEVHLTQTEYKILLLLCSNSGKVLTYDYIIHEIWGPYSESDIQILRVNMANIRRKIEKDPALPELFRTEIGVGYRMVEMTIQE